MSNLNKVMLIGHCAAKPEAKTTTSGKKLAKIRLATNSTWRDEEGDHKTTEWHDVVAWDRLSETCVEFIDKGKLVFVEGRLRTNSWTNEAGEERSRKEIIASRVTFLGSKPQAELPAL
jgi:single-strand DNA-binding protein